MVIQEYLLLTPLLIFSSSSTCLLSNGQHLKPQGVTACPCACETERDNQSKSESSYVEQHVTDTSPHKGNQVTARLSQNNSRHVHVSMLAPHKHTTWLLFSRKHGPSHTAVKSRPLAGFAAFVFSKNNLFPLDHMSKHFESSLFFK